MGFSPGWVAMAKQSIASIAPRFNSMRMVSEYVSKSYSPATRQWSNYSRQDFSAARALAAWKARIREAWGGVSLRPNGTTSRRASFGEGIHIEVAMRLNGLDPQDVTVELLLGYTDAKNQEQQRIPLVYQGQTGDGEALFVLTFAPELCGKMEYQIRAFPYNALLSHPFEMGMMIWL